MGLREVELLVGATVTAGEEIMAMVILSRGLKMIKVFVFVPM